MTLLTLGALTLLSALAASAAADDTMMASVNKCVASNPVPADVLQYVMQNQMRVPNENDAKARCFVECLLRENGDLTQGKFDPNKASENVGRMLRSDNKPVPANIKSVFNECSKQTGQGDCMTNYVIVKCIHSKINFA